MATMRCARRHARGHQLQRCQQRVGLLVNLYQSVLIRSNVMVFHCQSDPSYSSRTIKVCDVKGCCTCMH